MIVKNKPNYLVKNLLTATAMAYKRGGKAVKLFIETPNEPTFIGYGVQLNNGELL